MGAWVMLVFLAAPAFAAGPGAGAVAAPAVAQSSAAVENPFNLDFLYNERGTQVRLNYRLRWDFGDARKIPTAVEDLLRSPLESVRGTSRSIGRGARLRLYGLSLKPSKLIVFEESRPRPEAGGASGAAGAVRGEGERRARLSLASVFEDARRNLPEDIRREAVNQVFSAALPPGRDIGYGEKRTVLEGILQLDDVWGLPALDRPLKTMLGPKAP